MNTEQHPIVMVNVDLIDIVDQPIFEQEEKTKQGIMESIRDSGLIYEIVVQKQPNGRYIVIDGRTRLEAVRRLGEKYIACKYKEEDPYAPELTYELELCRRALTPEQRQELEQKHKEIKTTSITNLRDKISRKLSPDMRSIYQSMSDKGTLSKEWNTLFWLIAQRPQAEQKAFFEQYTNTDRADDSASEEIVEELQNKIQELEDETKQLKAKEAEMIKSAEKMQHAIKARFDQELKERVDAIRQEFQETMGEGSASGAKYEAHIAEIRKELEERYQNDVAEMNANLRNMSKAKESTQKELDVLKVELKTVTTQKKDIELTLRRKNEDVENMKQLVSELASAPKVVKQFETTYADIKNISHIIEKLPIQTLDRASTKEINNLANMIIDAAKMIINNVAQKEESARTAA